jgi:hypothetical protein
VTEKRQIRSMAVFPDLTQEQKEILIGSMLGDGGIYTSDSRRNPRFQKSQCNAFKDCLIWLVGKLKPYSCDNLSSRKSGIEGGWQFYTHSDSCFVEWRDKWYVGGRKIVPIDLCLTPLSLAIWFADDGQNIPTERRVAFHTCGFTNEENEFLMALLFDTFNIKSRLNHPHGYPTIFVRSESYLDFLEVVRPCFYWESMAYKVSIDKHVEPLYVGSGEDHPRSKFSDEVVQDVLRLIQQGLTRKEVSLITGVSLSQISNYKKGRRRPL